MSDYIEQPNIYLFKKRLAQKRSERKMSQETLAHALGYEHRSKISTWESNNKQTVPDLYDFYSLCKVLNCDPNCLLGYDDIEFENDKLAADYTKLSPDTIATIRENPFMAKFVDAMINSDKTTALFSNLIQLFNDRCNNTALDGIFSEIAIERLRFAFDQFFYKEITLDMNADSFVPYVAKAFPWNRNKLTFKEFVDSIIIHEKYYDMIISNPAYPNQTDDERYSYVISDIAKSSYKYLFSTLAISQKEAALTHIVELIIKDFIETQLTEFKETLGGA